MSDPKSEAHHRDLRFIEGLVSNWHWAAAPITAALGLLGVRLISSVISDWEITRDIIFWLYEVVPGDDLESKSSLVLLISAGAMLLVSLLIVKEIVSFVITQRILSRVNRTPWPMNTIEDMNRYIANHSNSSMRERFFFVSRGESISRADSTNAGHRGSYWSAFGYSIIGLFLLGLVI